MTSIPRWILYAALLAAAAGGSMLYDSGDDGPSAERTPSDAPDAYLEEFVTVEMDATGRPRRRIEADRMAYQADQTVELTSPRYVLFRAEGEPWQVQSEHGRLSADGTELWLLGKVHIWRNDEAGTVDLDIRTEHLKVLPDDEYGETDRPVTIRTPGSFSTGIGMRAWLDETRFELLSEVRTHVDGPPPRQ